jgi:hypothetical protein
VEAKQSNSTHANHCMRVEEEARGGKKREEKKKKGA